MSDHDLLPEDRLLLTASPHLKSPDSTPKIMWNVVYSLIPIVLASIYYFGPSAALVLLAATLGSLLPERLGKRLALQRFGDRDTAIDELTLVRPV